MSFTVKFGDNVSVQASTAKEAADLAREFMGYGRLIADVAQPVSAALPKNGAPSQQAHTVQHTEKALHVVASGGADKDNEALALLHAGGYHIIRNSTRKIFAFLLANRHRAWSADELANRLDMERARVSNNLSLMTLKKVIIRVGLGQYKVT